MHGKVSRGFLADCLLALLIVGVRWIMVDHFAGEVPYADQWGAEGEMIYLPLLRGQLAWEDLFSAWNEHRIVPTKILDLLLFTITGHQWDPILQLTVSALLYATWLGLAAGWTMRRTPRNLHVSICGVAITIGVLPFAFENTLWGFQSSFYFMMSLSTAAGWGLLSSPAGRSKWWLGMLAGVLAVFSLGSGGLVGGAILVVITIRVIKRGGLTRSDLFTGLVAAGLVLATWVSRVDVAAHAKMIPDSWMAFSVAWLRLAAWPFSDGRIMALVVWAPYMAFLAYLLMRRHVRSGPLAEAALFLGSWVIIQITALAVMRGLPLTFLSPASRYMDFLALGLMANVLAFYSLSIQIKHARWLRVARSAWLFTVSAGVITTSWGAVSFIENWHRERVSEKDGLALFLRTGEVALLENAQRLDHAAGLVKSWNGKQARSLPPAMQVVPPVGFGFPENSGWEEGAFDSRAGLPGGYAAWGNWVAGNSTVGRREVISAPFVLERHAVMFSYAMSPHLGRCIVEFVRGDGNVAAAFSAYHTPGGDPQWRETGLRVQPGIYRLRIHDDREGGNFAITAPRQISFVGFAARSCLKQGYFVFLVAGIGLTTVLVWQSPSRVF